MYDFVKSYRHVIDHLAQDLDNAPSQEVVQPWVQLLLDSCRSSSHTTFAGALFMAAVCSGNDSYCEERRVAARAARRAYPVSCLGAIGVSVQQVLHLRF